MNRERSHLNKLLKSIAIKDLRQKIKKKKREAMI